MILKCVEAENILKYRSLRLTDLPARGHIAVAGPNEAGKTAIGETICFGLFGRTFSLGRDEIDRVIRWGEYRGSVSVTFIDRDDVEFTVTREIDNTGRHHARLHKSDALTPLAEGVEAVDQALLDICGFTYQSFVDSFYLAQREMEVPHAKSATVKALIGVDKLEAAARDLEGEVTETTKKVHAVENEIREVNRSITGLNIDRARLGRLESERETKDQTASEACAKGKELTRHAATIDQAAATLTKSAALFGKQTTETNYTQWRDSLSQVSRGLSAANRAATSSGLEVQNPAQAQVLDALKSIGSGLSEYDKVRDLVKLYRQRVLSLLEDGRPLRGRDVEHAELGEAGDVCFAHRKAAVQARIDPVIRHRKIVLVGGVCAIEAAMLTGAAWAAPQSFLGQWMHGLVGQGVSGRSVLLLLATVVATAATVALAVLYARIVRRVKQHRSELEEIDREAELARVELEMIEAAADAPLPSALEGLRCVRNDLLRRSVAAFFDGDGAVLVRPDALAGTLERIREGAASAAQAMQEARARYLDRVEHFKKEDADARNEVARLDQGIVEERNRWKRLETLERKVASLASKGNELRHEIVIRTVAGELIEGACRQIYERFLPELRAFVSRILPRLTEGRYEQLEIDDDLRVRVFCKEKNDFVGLTEISNGTHRQLMLCVRLALSQALIASSGKTAQFIFFDEPFAFFDEQRMAKAIDVLRKISPEITQVFLAAQRFDDPDAFDMYLNCTVDTDTIEACAKPRRRMRVAG